MTGYQTKGSIMNTLSLCEVSTIIKDFRLSRGLNQHKMAAAIGISSASVSLLENLHNNRLTPQMYNALLTVGLDVKEKVPSVIIEKIAGGKRISGTPDLSVSLKRKDPIKLLQQARDLVVNANKLINDHVTKLDEEKAEKERAIAELDSLKKDILSRRDSILTEILDSK